MKDEKCECVDTACPCSSSAEVDRTFTLDLSEKETPRIALGEALYEDLDPPNPDKAWDTFKENLEKALGTGKTEIKDRVYKPKHYVGYKIEPITFIMENGLNFWQGSIIKYVCRAGRKEYENMSLVDSEITDLEKVRRYAEMRINQLKGKKEL